MDFEPRPVGFVLVSTGHGTLIVNRFDVSETTNGLKYGMGFTLLAEGMISRGDINFMFWLLQERRKHFGERVMVLDCGANIGTHTVSLAAAMAGWGNVAAFEAQERVYYALAGNLAINNCFNAQAIHAAIGETTGTINVPHVDFLRPGSFGSLELRQRDTTEDIGQPIDYHNAQSVKMISIDSLNLKRVDLIKLDIEGMELEALHGAHETLLKHKPILFVEHIKTDLNALTKFFEDYGYSYIPVEINMLAIHQEDPSHELLVNKANADMA